MANIYVGTTKLKSIYVGTTKLKSIYIGIAKIWGGFELPTFTGQHTIFGDNKKGRIECYSSGVLNLSNGIYDLFAVGGGAAGVINNGTGGGGGYTKTFTQVSLGGDYSVSVGAGGYMASDGVVAGGTSGVTDYIASGAQRDSGGSGGGGIYHEHDKEDGHYYFGGAGGSDGSDGYSYSYSYPAQYVGIGQHSTTRAFSELSNTLYAGGGGAGGNGSGGGFAGAGGAGGGGAGSTGAAISGTPNTGGGGGTGGYTSVYAQGGSGIVIIRWEINV